MEQTALDSLMKETANDAVANLKEQLDITLQYDADNIEHIDTAIHHYLDTYHTEALEDKVVFTLCHMYGAFMGEVFKRLVGGEWKYDDSDPAAPTTLLHYEDKSFAFAGICYERLVKDQSVSVKKYFDLALSFATH